MKSKLEKRIIKMTIVQKATRKIFPLIFPSTKIEDI
jgi:hypothetical protein